MQRGVQFARTACQGDWQQSQRRVAGLTSRWRAGCVCQSTHQCAECTVGSEERSDEKAEIPPSLPKDREVGCGARLDARLGLLVHMRVERAQCARHSPRGPVSAVAAADARADKNRTPFDKNRTPQP